MAAVAAVAVLLMGEGHLLLALAQTLAQGETAAKEIMPNPCCLYVETI